MGQRLSRARFRVAYATRASSSASPDPDELGERLAAVLAVVYLVFNEGYLASAGRTPERRDLAAQAVSLARLLYRLGAAASPEVLGLLGAACCCTPVAGAAARFDTAGAGWIWLADQGPRPVESRPGSRGDRARSTWRHRGTAARTVSGAGGDCARCTSSSGQGTSRPTGSRSGCSMTGSRA